MEGILRGGKERSRNHRRRNRSRDWAPPEDCHSYRKKPGHWRDCPAIQRGDLDHTLGKPGGAGTSMEERSHDHVWTLVKKICPCVLFPPGSQKVVSHCVNSLFWIVIDTSSKHGYTIIFQKLLIEKVWLLSPIPRIVKIAEDSFTKRSRFFFPKRTEKDAKLQNFLNREKSLEFLNKFVQEWITKP